MPTRRTPISRQPRISPDAEWVAKFRRMCELAPIYNDCCLNRHCRSTDPTKHCDECEEHIGLSKEFKRHFKFPPWKMLPNEYLLPDGLTGAKATAWWTEALDEALEEVRVR
jgi:hypothetical protein